MSVTTSVPINQEKLGELLPSGYSWSGPFLHVAAPKTITAAGGVSDAALQTAINTAAAAFVDYDANRETLKSRGLLAIETNSTFLDLVSPTNAQTLAQVKALTRQTNAVVRLLLGALDDTSNT